MFNVNWLLLVKMLLPQRKRKPIRMEWLFMLVRPLRQAYIIFLTYRRDTLYKLSITSQIIYLEKLLNDQFNNGLPAYTNNAPTGIYISDPTSFIFPQYVWNVEEQRPVIYMYNNWDAAVQYLTGEFSVEDNTVYKARANSINKQPSINPGKWEVYSTLQFSHNEEEFDGEYEFIVNVPDTLVDVGADPVFVATMKAWINIYRIAGKRYNIVNYTP